MKKKRRGGGDTHLRDLFKITTNNAFHAFEGFCRSHGIFTRFELTSPKFIQVRKICLRGQWYFAGRILLLFNLELFLEFPSKVFGNDVGASHHVHGDAGEVGDMCTK